MVSDHDKKPHSAETDDDGEPLNSSSACKMLGSSSEVNPMMSRMKLNVYKRRWIILLAVVLVNNSNTMSWISFASIANHVDAFYGMSKAANWFSLIYMLCTIPVGIFAMWIGSKFGMKATLLVATWLNVIGSTIRLASSFIPIDYRFGVGIFGQGLAACAYPFIMILPTKVAGSWFPENERTMATAIGVMSNPVGVLMANLISPQIVIHPSHVPIINIITFVPSCIACAISTVGVRRSQPKTPPTISAAQSQLEFIPGLKSVVSSKSFRVLFLVIGGGIGMFNCLYTVLQQLLCVSGYANTLSGFCAAFMIVGGVLGSVVIGIFVDRTKLHAETVKVSLAIAVIFGLIFLQLSRHPNMPILLCVFSFLFGAFGLTVYPIALELAAECTFPTSETTSSGLIILSGQVHSVIYVGIMQGAAKKLRPEYMDLQVCSILSDSLTSRPLDYTQSIIIISCIAALLPLMLFGSFEPEYNRSAFEKKKLPYNAEETEMEEKKSSDGIERHVEEE